MQKCSCEYNEKLMPSFFQKRKKLLPRFLKSRKKQCPRLSKKIVYPLFQKTKSVWPFSSKAKKWKPDSGTADFLIFLLSYSLILLFSGKTTYNFTLNSCFRDSNMFQVTLSGYGLKASIRMAHAHCERSANPTPGVTLSYWKIQRKRRSKLSHELYMTSLKEKVENKHFKRDCVQAKLQWDFKRNHNFFGENEN